MHLKATQFMIGKKKIWSSQSDNMLLSNYLILEKKYKEMILRTTGEYQPGLDDMGVIDKLGKRSDFMRAIFPFFFISRCFQKLI